MSVAALSHPHFHYIVGLHKSCTRMMNQKKYKPSLLKSGGVEAAPIYKSSVDCLIQTVKSEGPRALYKGFCPTWVRLGPWNIIFFMMYEQLKKVY